MEFAWNDDRSDDDMLVLEMLSNLLRAHIMHANHMVKAHDSAEYLCFDFDEPGIIAAMDLLDIDAEWIVGFMHLRQKGGLPVAGNLPAVVLMPGYSFDLRRVSTCDEATSTKPCCVRPFMYIVKDQSTG